MPVDLPNPLPRIASVSSLPLKRRRRPRPAPALRRGTWMDPRGRRLGGARRSELRPSILRPAEGDRARGCAPESTRTVPPWRPEVAPRPLSSLAPSSSSAPSPRKERPSPTSVQPKKPRIPSATRTHPRPESPSQLLRLAPEPETLTPGKVARRVSVDSLGSLPRRPRPEDFEAFLVARVPVSSCANSSTAHVSFVPPATASHTAPQLPPRRPLLARFEVARARPVPPVGPLARGASPRALTGFLRISAIGRLVRPLLMEGFQAARSRTSAPSQEYRPCIERC